MNNVDLNNCDKEPIHILGAIQPIGYLVTVSSDWLVSRVSDNIAGLLQALPADIIGKPLADFLPSRLIHDLRNRVAILRGNDSVERIFGYAIGSEEAAFDIAIHISGSRIVVEFEPGTSEHGDATGTVRSMITRLDQVEDIVAFYREGARQIRALLGYDRVMVYKFAADDSGEVVAEACKSGIGSFLGLHYPASDIPPQARALYVRNLLRVITDVHAKPVKITPQLDETGQPLDMSLSVLRAVSPIHLEYLKNMGVGASLSISIIIEGKLWGLFACHHYSARRPTFERRSVSELFAQMFSMRLESRERRELVEYERRAREVSDQLLGAVASNKALLKDPDWLADILTSTVPADGIGVWINGSYAFSGVTPSTKAFRKIIRALNGTVAGKVFATDHIASFVEGAESFASSSAGLLAIPISRSPRDYVVLFRSEIIRSVRWAGDPHKPAEYGPNGPRLTPRESFAEWSQLVKGRSEPFKSSELRVAETLRTTLIEVVLRLTDEAAVERNQAAARQELLIAELNHRVRNILGVIRGLIRQSQPDDLAVQEYVQHVDGRIHALARAHNQLTDDHWGPAPLSSIIDAEADAFVGDHRQSILASGPATLLNPQAYATMALVIHELVTNSIKYGSLSSRGIVKVDWERISNGDLQLRWQEEGGPPVKPPQRKGFGTTIVERSVPYDLGGSASIDYAKTGVSAIFKIPSRHVSESKRDLKAFEQARRRTHHDAPPPSDLLADRSFLLVEDSLIIALDAEDVLGKLGAKSVTPVSTVEAALDYLEDERPSAAVLDINLGDTVSFIIADRLLQLGIPYMFATGYGEQAKLPDHHRASLVLQKPYTIENVARAVSKLFVQPGP